MARIIAGTRVEVSFPIVELPIIDGVVVDGPELKEGRQMYCVAIYEIENWLPSEWLRPEPAMLVQ